MRNWLARQTEISFCSAEISARRADFFPYDSSSPANRADLVFSAHAHCANCKQTFIKFVNKHSFCLQIHFYKFVNKVM